MHEQHLLSRTTKQRTQKTSPRESNMPFLWTLTTPHLLEAKGRYEAKQEEVLTTRRFSDEAAAAALLVAIATSVIVKACERERKQAAAAV